MSNSQPDIRFKSQPEFKKPLLNQLADRAGIELEPINAYKSDQTWDELENLYQVTAQTLVDTAINVNSAIRVFNEAELVQPEVKITIDGIKRDLASRTEALVEIHAQHEGRTGRVQSAQENAAAIETGLSYVTFNEETKVLFFQPLATLTEYLNVAHRVQVERAAAAEAAATANAQDPNAVTDVVAKPVTANQD